MRILSLGIGLVGLIVGGSAFGRGWATGRDALLQQGSTIVVASLALMGVAAGLSTWRDERRRVIEEKQRAVYAELVRQLLARFGQGLWDEDREIQLRSEVVTWGHPRVLRALDSWLRTFDEIVPAQASGTVDLTPHQRNQIQRATASVAAAVRDELGNSGRVTLGEIEGTLFNHPRGSVPQV